jgi:hypothetical protein
VALIRLPFNLPFVVLLMLLAPVVWEPSGIALEDEPFSAFYSMENELVVSDFDHVRLSGGTEPFKTVSNGDYAAFVGNQNGTVYIGEDAVSPNGGTVIGIVNLRTMETHYEVIHPRITVVDIGIETSGEIYVFGGVESQRTIGGVTLTPLQVGGTLSARGFFAMWTPSIGFDDVIELPNISHCSEGPSTWFQLETPRNSSHFGGTARSCAGSPARFQYEDGVYAQLNSTTSIKPPSYGPLVSLSNGSVLCLGCYWNNGAGSEFGEAVYEGVNWTTVPSPSPFSGLTELMTGTLATPFGPVLFTNGSTTRYFNNDFSLRATFSGNENLNYKPERATCFAEACIFPAVSEGFYDEELGQISNGVEVHVQLTFDPPSIEKRISPLNGLLWTGELSSALPSLVFYQSQGTVVNGENVPPGFLVVSTGEDWDGDGLSDDVDTDDDNDGVPDAFDACSKSLNSSFVSLTYLDHDGDGCEDSVEDADVDNDGLEDEVDACPAGLTNWVRTLSSDSDSDGCHDLSEDMDDDNDGVQDIEDACPRTAGASNGSTAKGCPDADGDGIADVVDAFVMDASEWSDKDQDGVGDNADWSPLDATQHSDSDGDGFGDNPVGNNGDDCPAEFGTSTRDRRGCPDADGDGFSTAGDGFPTDPTRWQDTDGDGVDDSTDAFPFNAAQSQDRDADGYGDNPLGGLGSDVFPDDSTQWSDIDGDGYGDNPNGNAADSFIADPTQWMDRDGDGYGDNPTGRAPDMFPTDATQWKDEDGDGLGDNLSGQNPDPYLFDFDNDGYNDSIDPLPKLASPGDLDNDGCLDADDAFPSDGTECSDADGDGVGDNSDTDDDNDGWADTDELRQGTDPYSSSSQPIEAFEVLIPGTTISLGGWDLLGMLGGVPLFIWVMFGMVSRNGRSQEFEHDLRAATSRTELAAIATRWERALMLRLLGTHHAIRLERLRAELDDYFEAKGQSLDLMEPLPEKLPPQF